MESNFVLTDIKPTSQAHCWQLLLDGYILKHIGEKDYLKLISGRLCTYNAMYVDDSLTNASKYQVYREQNLTDLLEDGPILCSAVYNDSEPRVITLITNINSDGPNDEWVYENTMSFYKDAIPVTLEELKPYLLEYKTGTLK